MLRTGKKRIGLLSVWIGSLLLVISPLSWANGDRYDSLVAGDQVYRGVLVRSINETSLIVTHSGGLSQIPLKSLSPELQAKYGYSDTSAANREASLERMRRQQIIDSKQRIEKRRQEEAEARKRAVGAGEAAQQFGVPPTIETEVDLRPKFKELGISVRNQGHRPSCAIHAVVGAMEYLEGRMLGTSENLSEYYLYWATLKTLGRYDQGERWTGSGGLNEDAGFYLPEVFQALHAFGIPNNNEAGDLGKKAGPNELEAPSPEVVQKARARSKIRAFAIPGRDRGILLSNVIHALNAGEPVVVGMGWPNFQAIRKTAYIENQKPRENYGHAVTLVGYRSPSQKLEDTTFIFRNSWGPKWGAGGYGYVRYKFIVNNIFSAYVMEPSES